MSDQLMKLACVIAGADYDILRDGNRIDRLTVSSNALQLVLIGLLAVLVWSVFFASFMPLYKALPLGLLIGAIVFMLDRALSVSDWSLSGVLRPQRPSWGTVAKIGGRVAVGASLAVATAFGVTLALCAGAIDQHIRSERQARNQPLIDEYAEAKRQARDQLVDPIAAEVKQLMAERSRLQAALAARESALTEARQRASAARVEAQREREGGLRGYVAGEGPRFRDAKRLEQEAMLAAQTSAAETAAMQARFDALGPLLVAKNDALRQAVHAAANEQARLDRRMQSDPRWAPERNDPLSRAMALEALKRDPALGPAVERFDWMAKLVLVTLELSFMLVKLMSPPSVYMVRLIARTRSEAARAAREHVNDLREMRVGQRDNVQVPRMRVVEPSTPTREQKGGQA